MTPRSVPRRSRRQLLLIGGLAALAGGAGALPATAGAASGVAEYQVLYKKTVSLDAARSAVRAAGGRVVDENRAVRLATVVTRNRHFLRDVARSSALVGATENRRIGLAPVRGAFKGADVERPWAPSAAWRSGANAAAAAGGDPLSGLQWGMRMIGATPAGSYAVNRGRRGVLVGILDTGIDASHPDLRRNFSWRLSRNFTRDIPLVDGPCHEEPDRSCSDPATVDEGGHGTHVAGIVGAALNGLGVAGVAPDVRLVNIRAGQDSGYFFLRPTVNALTYAGDVGVDVVNMSYFIDPWLYNCRRHPADTPAEQMQQRTIIAATQRALDYAHARGVTLIAASGNQATDLGRPTIDEVSPDFPPGQEKRRRVNNSCLNLPTEGRHVLSINGIAPSRRKAYYSNYGVEQSYVSAPGGDIFDYFGTPQFESPDNLILSPVPKRWLRELGLLDEHGNPTSPFVVRNCVGGVCGYYAYFQGTSMASPHAVGVAALIVGAHGTRDAEHGGLHLAPRTVARILRQTATDRSCPSPRLFDYPGLPAELNAFCAGTREFNGFYGHGIVNALRAVGG